MVWHCTTWMLKRCAASFLFEGNYNRTVASPRMENVWPSKKCSRSTGMACSLQTWMAPTAFNWPMAILNIVTVPAWSPDGNWLIASVHDPNPGNQPNATLALILVDDCQIIPLPTSEAMRFPGGHRKGIIYLLH